MRRFWPAVLLLIFSLGTPKIQAQETGPLLMKQELGYTLAGSVVGVGIASLLWFTDPLSPDVQAHELLKDGFVVGTFLGSMFGFYALQNALNAPVSPGYNRDNLEQLLGQYKRDKQPKPLANSILTIPFVWKF